MNSKSVVLLCLAVGVVSVQSDTSKLNIVKCGELGVTGIINCGAMRALKSLEVISKLPVVEIFPGIAFENSNETDVNDTTSKSKSSNEIPRDMYSIMDAVATNIINLISGKTIRIKLTAEDGQSVSRALSEGRAKMKKMVMPLFMGLAGKLLLLVPLALGGVALLTTKALVVAKAAFVLAAVVFAMNLYQNRFSGGGGGGVIGGGIGSYFPPDYGYGTTYQPYGVNNLGNGYGRSA